MYSVMSGMQKAADLLLLMYIQLWFFVSFLLNYSLIEIAFSTAPSSL